MKVLKMNWKVLATLTIIIAFAAAFSATTVNAFPFPKIVGQVYTIDNAVAGNNVLVFNRWSDGSLTGPTTYSTGGTGTGIAFHSQGAVALSEDGQWLIVVDAGSNQISVFQVQWNTLRLTDVASSHGTTPISITINNNLVYVLNSVSGNIAGFWLSETGKLTYIAGSNKGVTGTSPEQIGFNPEGNVLVVTAKGSNLIDTYRVYDGVAGIPMTTASAGSGPYGFAFNNKGYLVDSEAASASASSYALSYSGKLTTISGAVSNGASGTPCWVAVTENGRIAYTGNAGGGVSIYSISHDGMLSLSSSVGATVSGAALDLALSDGSNFLYVMNAGSNIVGFEVGPDGSLSQVTSTTTFAGSAAGLAAT